MGAQVSSKDGLWVQRLAVQFLCSWADTSLVNCGKIAAMGGGPALATALTHTISQPGSGPEALQRDLLRAMAVLARDCPLRYARHSAAARCLHAGSSVDHGRTRGHGLIHHPN